MFDTLAILCTILVFTVLHPGRLLPSKQAEAAAQAAGKAVSAWDWVPRCGEGSFDQASWQEALYIRDAARQVLGGLLEGQPPASGSRRTFPSQAAAADKLEEQFNS